MITASAPGKVILCGEYAVLDAAPAICVAVDKRATVRVAQSDRDWHRVIAPGFSATEGRFVTTNDALEWLQGGSEFGLVEAVINAAGIVPETGLSIELDTQDFVDAESGMKIGVGSSAALTVALLAALRKTNDVYDDALEAHRLFQKGVGSGADIATAAHGGLIEFRAKAKSVRKLAWPEGLACRFIFSGVAVDTRDKLAKLACAQRHESWLKLLRSAAVLAAAWRSADTVLNEYPAYIEDLRRFSVDHGLGIFDAGHERLARRAAAAGLVYKPCGAGGGDVGVLLGRSEQALDEFVADDPRVLQCAIDPRGVEQH